MWTSLIWMSTKLCFSKTCLYSFAVCLITVNVRWRTDAIRIKVTRVERGKTSKYGSFWLVGNTAYDLWLAPWAGKMILILRCDWVPQRTSWNYSPSPRLRKVVLLSLYNKPKQNLFGQNSWILASFFFSVLMDRDGVRYSCEDTMVKDSNRISFLCLCNISLWTNWVSTVTESMVRQQSFEVWPTSLRSDKTSLS